MTGSNRSNRTTRHLHNHLSVALICSCVMAAFSGCVTFTKHAIPAGRLPNQFQAPSKSNLLPINFALLGKQPSSEHLFDTGDVVGVTVAGVIPADPSDLPQILFERTSFVRDYYPALGMVDGPNVGLPARVQPDGTISLPKVAPINVRGLSSQQAATRIAQEYIDANILKESNKEVHVVLLRSRVNRVVVLREDASMESAQYVRKGEAVAHKRGSAMIVDLPIYESDVLHALAASGGLPGVDAYNEIWILRKSALADSDMQYFQQQFEAGQDPSDLMCQMPAHAEAVKIPLKLCCGQPVNISQHDISLHDGDIVYIEPRKDEYFYTGGLLPGGQIPMPRDEDLDVIEAIALAQGSVGGLGGTSSVAVLRAGAGVGNIIPPTRVLVLRKLPNGQQLPIRLDLNVAMKDPSERIRIMAGDYIMMYYKPSESTANAVLNFFNFNWLIN